MSSKDKRSSADLTHTKPTTGNGSCLRGPGLRESDTGDSGEESEPTYRHYDNFETDVCLTQDEDDDEPMGSNMPLVPPLGANLTPTAPTGRPIDDAKVTGTVGGGGRESLPRENGYPGVGIGPGGGGRGLNPGVSSDSDSCTETEMSASQCGHGTDDTLTTSTSESEETQIWVPVSKRPSTRQDTPTTPPHSATSSNESEPSRPQSYIHRSAHAPTPVGGISVGSLTILGTPTLGQADRDRERERDRERQGIDYGRRDSHDSWGVGAGRRASPSKQINLGLLHRDENTGTITLDIRNLPNGDSGLGHEEVRFTPSDEVRDLPGGATASMQRPRSAREASARVQNISFLDRVCAVCSGLYMMAVVIIGVVIPLANIYVTTPSPALFEGFYIYLHIVSIGFLAYAYGYILKKRTFPFRRRRRTIVTSVPVQKRNRNLGEDEHQTGSFYLRLAAVGFGIGGMINIGLHFGEYFEMTSSSACSHALYGVRPILHLLFTFIQLYFVFLNSKMLTQKYKSLARFGLMHMIATNVCVWLEAVVKETTRQLGKSGEIDTVVNNTYKGVGDVLVPGDARSLRLSQCYGDSLMGEVVDTASPYLYPCMVIYSLICSGILLVMWLKLGTTTKKDTAQPDDVTMRQRVHVDCSSSSRGLFLGIIVFVAAIIILITFFVLIRTEGFHRTASQLDHLGDVAIYVLTTTAVILAFHRTHVLQYSTADWIGLEEALLVFSLTGVYILCVANIISGVLIDTSGSGHMIILSNCLRVIQSTIQTIFLLNTLGRRAADKEQALRKPGREFVTFLLVSNVALWGINMFEVQMSDANPVQLVFYGDITWYIIAHLSVPLTVFFRLHSTVCLANIWKHAWDCSWK